MLSIHPYKKHENIRSSFELGLMAMEIDGKERKEVEKKGKRWKREGES